MATADKSADSREERGVQTDARRIVPYVSAHRSLSAHR